MKLLENKIVVVTGGAGLIGKEFVKAILLNGGTAVIADMNEENSKKVIKEICDETVEKSKVDFEPLNITSKESILLMLDSISKKYGRLDAIVNNAYPRNKKYGAKFEDVTYHDFCENVDLHLGGYFLVSQQAALFFRKQGYGNIVNMSSIYGVVAPKFDVYDNTKMTMPVEYAAIKSAVVHLTKYMAKYFKGEKIRFNSISCGGIFDNQPESFLKKYKEYSLNKGMLDKSDVTGTLVYLLSDISKYVNGQNIIVDDGWSL